jgi:hypothetical protein
MFRNRKDTQVQEVRVNEEINQEEKGGDALLQTLHVNYLIIIVINYFTTVYTSIRENDDFIFNVE